MNKILKITSTICMCNISLLTSIYGMIPNRNNQISDDSSTVSVTEEDPNMQQQIAQLTQNVQATPQISVARTIPQYPAIRQPAQNVQPIQVPINFMPLGIGHSAPRHVASQPYQWVLTDNVTVDFTNSRYNEYLFEVRQGDTMIFGIKGKTLDSGHISFMTQVQQSGSWLRLPAGANAVIRFYRCANCGAITWHDHNNRCSNCGHNAPGANNRVFIFSRGLAAQLCKNIGLCVAGNCPITIN